MSDGPNNDQQLGDVVFRVVAAVALAISTVSGGITVTKTDDRVRGAEVTKDFALRDSWINRNTKDIERLQRDIERIDRAGPDSGNSKLAESVKSLERRISRLEK